MASVQGMPFTPSGLPSSANKEKGAFCLEAGSSDFFDEYVDLDESDAGSASGGAGGLGRFYGASKYCMSPQFSFVGQMLAFDGAQEAGAQGHLFSAENINCSGPPSNSAARPSPQRPQQAHPLHRTTSDMAALSNPNIEIHGLPYHSFSEACGGGSISDSELVKLEGLTMRSRIHLPQLSAPEPASPLPKSTSPRKAGRLKSACNRIRDVMTLHGKVKQAQNKSGPDSLSVPVMSTAQMEPARMSGRPRPRNLQITKAELPSPPLTSGLPHDTQQPGDGGGAAIVSGLLEALYMAEGLAHGQFVRLAQLSGGAMPQTPVSTPLMNSWQLPMSTSDGKTLWAANPYLPGVNGDIGNSIWDSSMYPMDTNVLGPYHAVNGFNASYNMSTQLQHQPSYEYPLPPGAADTNAGFTTNGQMIHMPQPQGVSPAVLHSDTTSHRPTRADHHRRPKPRAPSAGARHLQYGPGLSPHKGRTASGSGSTNANRIASVSPSPKPATGAAASLHRRSASLQTLNQPPCCLPTDGPASSAAIRKRRSWTGRRTSSSSSSLHHQYRTFAVTAARAASPAAAAGSPSRRRTASTITTTSSSSRPVSGCCLPSSSSSSFLHNNNSKRRSSQHHHHPTEEQEHEEGEEAFSSCEASKADDDGFVNYTARDSKVLMTGVAPSGSSKTKERREKAARLRELEKEREIEERVKARILLEKASSSSMGMDMSDGAGGTFTRLGFGTKMETGGGMNVDSGGVVGTSSIGMRGGVMREGQEVGV